MKETRKEIELKTLIEELNYIRGQVVIVKAYPTESRREVIIAEYGKTLPDLDIEIWHSNPPQPHLKKNKTKLEKLLSYECCIRCEMKMKTNQLNVYCFKCLGEISNPPKYELIGQCLLDHEDDERTILKEKYKWLNDIPVDDYSGLCWFCEDNYIKNHHLLEKYCEINLFPQPFESKDIKGRVKWNGEYRRCCTRCLDRRHVIYSIE